MSPRVVAPGAWATPVGCTAAAAPVTTPQPGDRRGEQHRVNSGLPPRNRTGLSARSPLRRPGSCRHGWSHRVLGPRRWAARLQQHRHPPLNLGRWRTGCTLMHSGRVWGGCRRQGGRGSGALGRDGAWGCNLYCPAIAARRDRCEMHRAAQSAVALRVYCSQCRGHARLRRGSVLGPSYIPRAGIGQGGYTRCLGHAVRRGAPQRCGNPPGQRGRREGLNLAQSGPVRGCRREGDLGGH